MLISEERLTANRANAAKSTAPQRRFHSSTSTPEGKSRSASSSRKHGFAASSNEALNGAGKPFYPMGPELDAGLPLDIEITRTQNRNYAMAEGFDRIARQPNGWRLFLRYQARTERLLRAVEEFDRLKAIPAELRNEPIQELQPEEKETACTPPDEPISAPRPNPPVGPAFLPETGCQLPSPDAQTAPPNEIAQPVRPANPAPIAPQRYDRTNALVRPRPQLTAQERLQYTVNCRHRQGSRFRGFGQSCGKTLARHQRCGEYAPK